MLNLRMWPLQVKLIGGSLKYFRMIDRPIKFKVSFYFGLLLIGLFGYVYSIDASAAAPESLFVDASGLKWVPSTQRYPEVVRELKIPIDVTMIFGRGTLIVDLPELKDRLVLEHLGKLKERSKETFIWTGKVNGRKHDSATFTLVNGILTGSIILSNGKGYRFRHVKGNTYLIQEIDRSKFPPEACIGDKDSDKPEARWSQPKFLKSSTAGTDDICEPEDPVDRIELLVVYTDDALSEATGDGASIDEGRATLMGAIEIAVNQTNLSYANSDIQPRLVLLDPISEIQYTEESSIIDELRRLNLPQTNDSEAAEIIKLRNRLAADIVVLVTHNGDSCGFAKTMGTVLRTFREKAFAIVPYRCLTEGFSFAHELGHLMGARHDRDADGTNHLPFIFNHGNVHLHPSDSEVAPWMTVMATRNKCINDGIDNCVRIDFWSNPSESFSYYDDLTGKENDTDNHQTLNRTGSTVANFKCSSSRAQ